MKYLRLSILGFAVVASAASVGPGNFPTPDDCSNPAAASVRSLSIVKLDSTAAFSDHDVVPLVIGGQGGEMVQYRVLLEGNSIPQCVAFEIDFDRCLDLDCLRIEGAIGSHGSQQLLTYEDGANRITKTHFQELRLFGAGSLAKLRISAGGAEDSVIIWLDRESDNFPDAGVGTDAQLRQDAGIQDAFAAPPGPN